METRTFYLVVLFLTLTGTGISVGQAETPKLSKHPVVIVVSFDGFRYDYMTKAKCPNLQSVKDEGISVPWMRAEFPTKTFPNHQTMATGLFPDVHGVTDNVLYDPKHGRQLNGFTDDPEFWNYSPDVLPLYIRNEQAGDDRYSGAFMWAGSSTGYGVNGDIYPTHYIVYNQSIPWEVRVETAISWITDKVKPTNLVYLYHNEPDSQGHKDGTDDESVKEVVRNTDDRAGYLIQKLKEAGIYDNVNLIFVSDHGMQTVSNKTIIDTRPMVDPTLYTNPGGSPVYQIWPKDSANEAQIYDAFKKEASLSNNGFRVYKKEELTFLNFTTNRRIPEIILLANPGYAFEDVIKKLNDKGVYGVHGYDNRSPNMYALFLARGPAFKKGYKSNGPIDNVDLVPMISKIIGIPAPPNNGTLRHTQDFFADKLSDNAGNIVGIECLPILILIGITQIFNKFVF